MNDTLTAIIDRWEFAEPPIYCKCGLCGFEWDAKDAYTLCDKCMPEEYLYE